MWTLVEACNRYLQKHFVEVSVSEEFLKLGFVDVREMISRDELNVQSEENVSYYNLFLISFNIYIFLISISLIYVV